MAKQYYVTKYTYATHSQRLINFFIDAFIASLLLFFFILLEFKLGSAHLYKWFASMNLIEELFLGNIHIVIYCLIGELFFGTTIGKLISRCKIVDTYGEKPTKQSMVTRSIARLIPFEIFSFLTEYCRGWHDKLSHTYVVDIETFNEEVKEFNEEQLN